MKLFDLHCDTITQMYDDKIDFDSPTLSTRLSCMQNYEKAIRLFAIFIPDELKDKNAYDYFCNVADLYFEKLSQYNALIKGINSLNDLENVHVGSILSLENSSALAGNISNIKRFADIGVKVATLTWNGENELAFGQLEDKPLKPFGKLCVTEYVKNGITVDVSHISDKGFYDICNQTDAPIIASHSNSRSVCNCKRNLKDDQIREIAARKGLIGLNLYKNFLNENPNDASINDILKHADKIISLGGENVLSLGTDFDGAEMIEEISNDSKVHKLYTLFSKNGYGDELTEKIMFNNANDFFKRKFKKEELK